MTTPSLAPAASAAGFLAAKELRVRQRRERERPTGAALEALRSRAAALPRAPSLRAALASGDCVALLAEFKRRSPSGGILAPRESPGSMAELYARGGARGVSVLTDAEDFGGSLEDLRSVVTTLAGPRPESPLTPLLQRGEPGSWVHGVSGISPPEESPPLKKGELGGFPTPVLRKDFLVDAADLYQARLAGASAALLIVGMLSPQELETLLRAAAEVHLECLVEVHDEDELERALAAGAGLIGINNRDLRLLTTDLAVTERLARHVPAGITLVSESGIRTPDDVARVRDAGAHAVLVGEALLRLPVEARRARVRALAEVPR
jgi:indole-3-glycerol phosphate synthase